MNKRNQGDQKGRGWLERSIFNILENQENVTSESSKNVSKATAGKCIRDTGTCVFTGGAVGHLATILTRYTWCCLHTVELFSSHNTQLIGHCKNMGDSAVPSNGSFRSQLCARMPLFRWSGQSESCFPIPRTMSTSEASVVFHTRRSSVISVSIDRQ